MTLGATGTAEEDLPNGRADNDRDDERRLEGPMGRKNIFSMIRSGGRGVAIRT